jgi:hypothetical protein
MTQLTDVTGTSLSRSVLADVCAALVVGPVTGGTLLVGTIGILPAKMEIEPGKCGYS